MGEPIDYAPVQLREADALQAELQANALKVEAFFKYLVRHSTRACTHRSHTHKPCTPSSAPPPAPGAVGLHDRACPCSYCTFRAHAGWVL